MKITLTVKDERITDLLHGHGGSISGSWLEELSGEWNDSKGHCRVKFLREDQEESENPKGRKNIGRRTVQKGLALMAEFSPRHFADFMNENDDDVTFDVFVQYCIFGKVIYG